MTALRRKIAAPLALLHRASRDCLARNAVVTFGPTGVVEAVEHDVPNLDGLPGLEYYNGVLIPGMVNAHLHLELSHLEGAMPRGTGLPCFAENIGKVRNDAPEPDQIKAAGAFDAQLYAQGVVAAGDVSNTNLSFAVKRRSKIRYHTFIECFGLIGEQNGRIVEKGRQLAREAADMGLSCSLTPHSTYSCSDPLFGRLAGLGDPLSIHFLESGAEREIFNGRGGFAAWYSRIVPPMLRPGETLPVERGWSAFGSPLEKLMGQVADDRRILLVHNTLISSDEIHAIGTFYSRPTFVLCPLSNLYIEGAVPPYTLFLEGCNVALGTDSLASSGTRYMIDVLKHAVLDGGVPLDQAARWATLGGAESLGMAGTLGSFEAGKTPGAALLTNIDWEKRSLTRQSQSLRIV